MSRFNPLLMAAALALAGTAGAALSGETHGGMDHSKMDHGTMAEADMTDATVRKVDLAQGKVTLKHGPIKNLDMPGMTMVFTVKDKAMLDSIKPGDKVRFKAADEGGRMMVTELMPAQ